MRTIIIIASLIIICSCKSDPEKTTSTMEPSKTTAEMKRSSEVMNHNGTHYIKYRDFNGSPVENETKTFNIDLQYHKLESPQTYVHHIKSIDYEENDDINICENFQLSDNGTSFTQIDMIQHADPFYTKTNTMIMKKALLGDVGCGPGLYFENPSDPKFLKTKIKDNGITKTYLPVSMAMHGDVHEDGKEYDLTPTYFAVDDVILSAIKDSILQGYVHVGTDTELTSIVSEGITFSILQDLKLCNNHDAKDENCVSFQ